MHVINRRSFVAVVAVFACVALSSCADDMTAESATKGSDATTSATGDSTNAAWSRPIIGGGSYDFASGPRERPLALWFWAPG